MPTSTKRSGNSWANSPSPGPVLHGSGDGNDPLVPAGHPHHGIAKNRGIGGRAFGLPGASGTDIKGPYAVEFARVFFRKAVSLALARDSVNQNRFTKALHIDKCLHQMLYVMAVDRAHILEAQVLEQSAGRHKAFEGLLELLGDRINRPAHGLRHVLQQDVLDLFTETGHKLSGHNPAQVRRHGTHIGRYGHLIVVEDDYQVLFGITRLIEPLVRHPARKRTVPHHCYHLVWWTSSAATAT